MLFIIVVEIFRLTGSYLTGCLNGVFYIGLTFEVIEGGFLDIDVRVTGPDGEEVISRERESNGKITFAAAKTGAYTYCFSNKMSTMTPKGVMFSMDVGEPQAAAGTEGEGEWEFSRIFVVKTRSSCCYCYYHDYNFICSPPQQTCRHD